MTVARDRGTLMMVALIMLALASLALGFFSRELFGDVSIYPLVGHDGWGGAYSNWYRWKGVYPMRSAFFALASLLLVVAVSYARTRVATGSAFTNSRKFASKMCGVVTWTIDDEESGESRLAASVTVKELVLFLILCVALIFLMVFLFQPKQFSQLSYDDGPIETASAVLLFVACGFFLYGALRTLHSTPWSNNAFRATSAMLALFLFVAGMEEISWGQRILGFETPYVLEGNGQNEFNIHNYNTGFFNDCYYMLGFSLFILLPFLKDQLEAIRKVEIFSFFIPSCFILFASAIGLAFTYARWSEAIYQLSFFITLFILIFYAWHLRSMDRFFFLPSLVIVYLLTQILLISYGHELETHWEVNEYKEFFIPLSFLLYSIEMFQKFKRGLMAPSPIK